MLKYQFVGVDVSKDKFDVASSLFPSCTFLTTSPSIKKFITFLKKHGSSPWVCMEATGHYSEQLAEILFQHNIRVSIVNPLQIKRFSQSVLVRNKNDIIDARVIALYGERMQPRPFQPRSTSQKELRDLIKFIDILKMQLVQLKNQLHSTQGLLAQEALKKAIYALSKKIKLTTEKTNMLVSLDADSMRKMDLLCSIKGIGKTTAYKFLAFVPDVSEFSHAKQFAAFIGVTPRQFQSGKYYGKTVISRLGNAAMRNALYMAALVAKRFNPALKPFVQRLKENGKSPKSIICAVMRKLAHVVYGVLKHGRPFDPIPHGA